MEKTQLILINEIAPYTQRVLKQLDEQSPKKSSLDHMMFYHYIIMRIEQENFKTAKALALQENSEEKINLFLQKVEIIVQDYLANTVVIMETETTGEKNGGNTTASNNEQ